ncbi:unknown similar to AMEV110 [Choristoneura biennis entomopoxvirus]|uniref:Uncharacterized protein n=1 Tax=Choristoneura biennis entomopoxvirus TaxID=10288 RepID=A0A916KPI4_CBEPV|nr:unknown similar to AMEV110 [Choristoneura biennis entomopoxvirus]CCU55691.1 unknown similar to AMEV110 [Choristoneura biennis entomopoxvirus]
MNIYIKIIYFNLYYYGLYGDFKLIIDKNLNEIYLNYVIRKINNNMIILLN